LHPDAEILEVGTAESEQPYRIRLAFSNPYAYRAAHMLGEYDALVRTCHTLKFVGAGEPDELQIMMAGAGHHIRRVFAIPQRFKVCAVDRDDMRQHNQRAQRAAQLMGPLPEAILNRETLPVFVPAGARPTPDVGSTTISDNAQPRDCEEADEARCAAEDAITL
jgi:integrating conjugative element protein (TIGR03761 family)